MIEYGTGNSRVAGGMGTCFAPRHADDPDTLLCDRDRYHGGRHAAWNDFDYRVYWVEPDDKRIDAHRGPSWEREARLNSNGIRA